jgi:hypothetical protein
MAPGIGSWVVIFYFLIIVIMVIIDIYLSIVNDINITLSTLNSNIQFLVLW